MYHQGAATEDRDRDVAATGGDRAGAVAVPLLENARHPLAQPDAARAGA